MQNQEVLTPLIQARQAARKLLDENPLNVSVKSMYTQLIVKIRGIIRKAKYNWLASRYDGLGRFPSSYWDNISELKKGLTALKAEDKIPLFRNKVGVKCKTSDENQKALEEFF